LTTSDNVAVPGRGKSETYGDVADALNQRTLDILDRRRRTTVGRRRGWLVRRMLFLADILGISLAFLVAELLFGGQRSGGTDVDSLVFLLTLPVWVLLAKLYGLYDRDEERTYHTTVDDVAGVFHVVTVGTFLLFATSWIFGQVDLDPAQLLAFWLLAIASVTGGRTAARAISRRSLVYLQNTLIVGAGDVGQLIARKMLQHPEYGINLVGFLDANPRARRADLGDLTILGPPERLPEIVRLLDVERVVIAFSGESNEDMLALVRSLRDFDLQIDIVPRLFEAVGPSADIHTVEGLPLVGLPSARISRSSRWLKRGIDVIGASIALLLTAPLFAFAAIKVKRSSPGPVFFRQTRLGMNMREFTIFKFRTMYVDTDDAEHREYIRLSMDPSATPTGNGLYKLGREREITPFGRWLRKTSLDELPQLINVLRGEMSLVGPRPCIPYETEHFETHHFERFLVPAGITGLWQVTGRAHTTFGEALDLDVAYVRGWSLGLDLSMLLQTARQIVTRTGTA